MNFDRYLLEMPEPILRVGFDGHVNWANRQGVELLERISMGVGDLLPQTLQTAVKHHVGAGTANASFVDDFTGRLWEFQLVGSDVFLRARATNDAISKQIQSVQKTKSAFLANMSHELRTPLNAILGYTELLKEEAGERGHGEYAGDLERVNTSAVHLLRLINDILDVSKIEAGRMGLFLEAFDIPELVGRVASTVQELAGASGNQLTVSTQPNLGQMRTDRTKLRQVLFNLLDNAAKFTENGKIELSAERDPHGNVVFTVTDTGIGMSEGMQTSLFEAFTQGDVSTTRRYGGTGLGLALCRLLAQILGGSIHVKSELGSGSSFRIVVPDRGGLHHQTPGGTERVTEFGDVQKPTILVIDDDPTVRDLLSRFLVREGYRVVTASDGETGLELAKRERPNAITLDVMMPRIDGWEVLRRLKGDPSVGQIPVLMVSIVDNTGLGFALGAADYLTKPIDRKALLSALTRVAGTSGRVLVVDDSAMLRDVMARTLRRAGWTVDEASDGAEALKYLESQLPSAILLDLMMPEVDGFQVVEALRAEPRWQRIPVLVITAKDLTPRDHARLLGAVETVMSKSTDTPKQVAAALGRMLSSD